jgi:ABC-type cobalt transport system substrate-binding protein
MSTKKSPQILFILLVFIAMVVLITYRTLEIAKSPADESAVDFIISAIAVPIFIFSYLFEKKSGNCADFIKALKFSSAFIPVALFVAHLYINFSTK